MTVKINLTAAWTEIATGPVLIQCHGETRVTASASEPAADASGHGFTNDAILPFRSPEKLWAKAATGTARVIVSALTGGTEGPT